MKIVITGGPSAGKTTVTQTVAREYGDRIAIVPEAASILFKGGFPREASPKGKTHQQRAIYFVQRELEAMIVEANPHKLVICDRGSLDGLAYWPGQQKSFFEALETNLAREIKRYDCVIHLDTAPHDGYETGNGVRVETHPEAVALNEKIKRVWRAHPRFIVIPNYRFFSQKLEHAFSVIEPFLKGFKRNSQIKNPGPKDLGSSSPKR